MRSIRLRLFTILLATTGAVWLFAVMWTYFSVQHQVERVLDARLMEAARMVSSLLTNHHIAVAGAVDNTKADDAGLPFDLQGDYRRQLSCQIWSLQGQLVSRSESAPHESLTDSRDGFSETSVDGVRWRVFAVVNPELNLRVLIGDSLEIRDRLVADVVKGQLVPADPGGADLAERRTGARAAQEDRHVAGVKVCRRTACHREPGYAERNQAIAQLLELPLPAGGGGARA